METARLVPTYSAGAQPEPDGVREGDISLALIWGPDFQLKLTEPGCHRFTTGFYQFLKNKTNMPPNQHHAEISPLSPPSGCAPATVYLTNKLINH